MTRKLLNAFLGLGLGVFTLPVILVAWPFVAAMWMWNETEENEKENQ